MIDSILPIHAIKQAHVSKKHPTRQTITVGKWFGKDSYFIMAKLCEGWKNITRKKNTCIAVTLWVLIFVLLSHSLVTPDSGNVLQLESPNFFKQGISKIPSQQKAHTHWICPSTWARTRGL